jgi:hypothetical protein
VCYFVCILFLVLSHGGGGEGEQGGGGGGGGGGRSICPSLCTGVYKLQVPDHLGK